MVAPTADAPLPRPEHPGRGAASSQADPRPPGPGAQRVAGSWLPDRAGPGPGRLSRRRWIVAAVAALALLGVGTALLTGERTHRESRPALPRHRRPRSDDLRQAHPGADHHQGGSPDPGARHRHRDQRRASHAERPRRIAGRGRPPDLGGHGPSGRDGPGALPGRQGSGAGHPAERRAHAPTRSDGRARRQPGRRQAGGPQAGGDALTVPDGSSGRALDDVRDELARRTPRHDASRSPSTARRARAGDLAAHGWDAGRRRSSCSSSGGARAARPTARLTTARVATGAQCAGTRPRSAITFAG